MVCSIRPISIWSAPHAPAQESRENHTGVCSCSVHWCRAFAVKTNKNGFLLAGLLDSLQNETPPSEVSPSPVGRLEAGYEPPTERQLLEDGLIEPVSLEMDAESDDELEALAEMYDPDNKGDETRRYTLLRELWSSAR